MLYNLKIPCGFYAFFRTKQAECDQKLMSLRDDMAADLYDLEEEYYNSINKQDFFDTVHIHRAFISENTIVPISYFYLKITTIYNTELSNTILFLQQNIQNDVWLCKLY